MALRSSAMNMPFSDSSMDVESARYNLPRKLVILILMVAAASLWMYVLFREKHLVYATPIQELAAGVVIAIVAGLGAQLILSKRDGLFRFVAAMTAEVAGVYLLGFVSSGKFGISKFGWLPGSIDYDGLNLIGLGFIIILFMSMLFRRTKVIVVPEPLQGFAPEHESENIASVQVEPSNSISVSSPNRPRISWSRFFNPGAVSGGRSNGRHSGMVQPAKVAPAVAPKRRRRKKPRVQLALVGEHRCPYCLDNVVRSDPRGIKECPVCHTLHHKDCWDITGSCQVPHLNT